MTWGDRAVHAFAWLLVSAVAYVGALEKWHEPIQAAMWGGAMLLCGLVLELALSKRRRE
jgi:hypothetical protein